MKIELFFDEDVHSRTLGDHCFKTTPIQRNDVKIVTLASAYCQRNNEESFGVLVDSLGHSTYLRTKSKNCHRTINKLNELRLFPLNELPPTISYDTLLLG